MTLSLQTMTTTFKVGDRVDTNKYGLGTVENFEFCGDTVHISNVYSRNGRVGVRLDEPDRWSLSKTTSTPPYFRPSELTHV